MLLSDVCLTSVCGVHRA